MVVVLAEVDTGLRRMMRVLLEHDGHVSVLEAADGREAELLCSADLVVDLVIVDLETPEMSTTKLIRILAARGQSPKLLLCTRGARAAGLNHLQKPFGPETFRAAVQLAIGGPTLAQQKPVTPAVG